MGQENTNVNHFVVQRAYLIVASFPCSPRRTVIYVCEWALYVCWIFFFQLKINPDCCMLSVVSSLTDSAACLLPLHTITYSFLFCLKLVKILFCQVLVPPHKFLFLSCQPGKCCCACGHNAGAARCLLILLWTPRWITLVLKTGMIIQELSFICGLVLGFCSSSISTLSSAQRSPKDKSACKEMYTYLEIQSIWLFRQRTNKHHQYLTIINNPIIFLALSHQVWILSLIHHIVHTLLFLQLQPKQQDCSTSSYTFFLSSSCNQKNKIAPPHHTHYLLIFQLQLK